MFKHFNDFSSLKKKKTDLENKKTDFLKRRDNILSFIRLRVQKRNLKFTYFQPFLVQPSAILEPKPNLT